jgi:hypothetical protein
MVLSKEYVVLGAEEVERRVACILCMYSCTSEHH